MKSTILLQLFLFFNLLLSQTLYVSPLGDNNFGDGTLSNPYLNIQYAIDAGASEVVLLEGVYTNFENITAENIPAENISVVFSMLSQNSL